jgi:hypothetical protein
MCGDVCVRSPEHARACFVAHTHKAKVHIERERKRILRERRGRRRKRRVEARLINVVPLHSSHRPFLPVLQLPLRRIERGVYIRVSGRGTQRPLAQRCCANLLPTLVRGGGDGSGAFVPGIRALRLGSLFQMPPSSGRAGGGPARRPLLRGSPCTAAACW